MFTLDYLMGINSTEGYSYETDCVVSATSASADNLAILDCTPSVCAAVVAAVCLCVHRLLPHLALGMWPLFPEFEL